jgi:hypothetical protein
MQECRTERHVIVVRDCLAVHGENIGGQENGSGLPRLSLRVDMLTISLCCFVNDAALNRPQFVSERDFSKNQVKESIRN